MLFLYQNKSKIKEDSPTPAVPFIHLPSGFLNCQYDHTLSPCLYIFQQALVTHRPRSLSSFTYPMGLFLSSTTNSRLSILFLPNTSTTLMDTSHTETLYIVTENQEFLKYHMREHTGLPCTNFYLCLKVFPTMSALSLTSHSRLLPPLRYRGYVLILT